MNAVKTPTLVSTTVPTPSAHSFVPAQLVFSSLLIVSAATVRRL